MNLINEDSGFYQPNCGLCFNQQRWRIQLKSVTIEDSTVTIAGWAIEKDRINMDKPYETVVAVSSSSRSLGDISKCLMA